MTENMHEQAEALFQCLPADDYDQVRVRLNRELGRRDLTNGDVGNVLAYVRKHYEECGYTVPHAKRGPPLPGEHGRFFAILVERDGTFSYDDEHRQHFNNGTRSSVASISQQMRNLKAIVATLIKYERSPIKREYLGELEEHFDYTAKRTARVLRFMDAA